MYIKSLLLFLFVTSLLPLNAQKDDNFKLGIDAGFIFLSKNDNLSFFINAEPKIKSSEKTVIGLRLGLAINSTSIENKDVSQFLVDETFDQGVFTFIPTCDYYFNGQKVKPYMGLGIGFHVLSNPLEATRVNAPTPIDEDFEIEIKRQIGLLARAGFDMNKLRLGIEYNFVPEIDLVIPNGPETGIVDLSYLGLSFGIIIGD